jgi:hypothetical protein
MHTLDSNWRYARTGLLTLLCTANFAYAASGGQCQTQTGSTVTPVIELYTSEGCSSCPPADQWLSSLKGKAVTAQAFHVGYWDYIGWTDRFATAANAERQRQLAVLNHLSGLYTPQLVKNGHDWRGWFGSDQSLADTTPAKTSITLQRNGAEDNFSARVSPADEKSTWGAYWSVTENGHNSRVKAGENAGEYLQHDFVVRQYTPVGRFEGKQQLRFFAIAPSPGHLRSVNLVVFDPKNGETLQSASLHCE